MYRDISKKQLVEATEILSSGGIVAIPTETVYGLAADATNPAALIKIFAAKNRPADHPLIVHIANVDQLAHWAKEIPNYAHKLAAAFWPGPMTLILKKQDQVLDIITGGQNTVGLRVPQHPIAQKILRSLNAGNSTNQAIGLAAPSANSFGQISPTLAEHVQQDLGSKIDLIIDGGICSVGIESTIIDCTSDQPRILRPGMISEEDINNILDPSSQAVTPSPINTPNTSQDLLNSNTTPLRVSGCLASHYAPKTQTVLISANQLESYCSSLNNYTVLSRHKPKLKKVKLYDSRLPTSFVNPTEHPQNWILMPEDHHAYAHSLYEQLHFADQLNSQQIIIEDVPENNTHWTGIRDRLLKASHPKD